MDSICNYDIDVYHAFVIVVGELAYYGHRVRIHDVNLKCLNKVFEIIEADKKSLMEDGLLFQKNFVV